MIVDKSCPPRALTKVCAIEGSTTFLTFILEYAVYYSLVEEAPQRRIRRLLSNFTLHADFYIYNVTPKDEGYYMVPFPYYFIKLRVSSK